MNNKQQIAQNMIEQSEQIAAQPSFFHYHQDRTLSPDHEGYINTSRNHFWNKIYQFPHYQPTQSFFNNHNHQNKNSTNTSAQQTWNKFNPQKAPNFEFDIFKLLKDTKDSENNSFVDVDQVKNEKNQPTHENQNNLIIQTQKPPPFMGAFTHVQPSFNFFNLNISIPTSRQYKPFSCFYQDQGNENQIQDQQLKINNLQVSKISIIKDIKHQDKNKYFFQIDSIQSQIIDEKSILEIKQSKINSFQENEEQKSILYNYSDLFQERKNFKHRDPIWESQLSTEKEIKQSRIFEVYRQENLKTIHSMELQLNLAQEIKEVLSDQFILSEASKILQNIQCELFTLDYASMQWSIELSKFRLQNSFKNSLKYRIKDLFLLANYRSRIDIALQYIRKRPFRRVYYQLGIQITQILILFEQIILFQSKNSSLIEFFLHLDKLKLQVTILYKLLINESFIMDEKRSYQDFDYRYLNSEYVIFKQIVKQSKFADSLNIQIKPLINNLLKAVFKPIVNILNNILFQQCTIIQLNDQIYLKYFFDNHKDIVSFISKKIGLIKEENNQLYLICKIKERIQVLNNLQDLEDYQHMWEQKFVVKRKLIERIRKNYKLKIKHEKQKKYEERMKFVYQLKSRIYQQKQEQNAYKRQKQQRDKQYLRNLKKQIDERKQRRQLKQKIEKQKQKGLLLDISLQEKQRLKFQKQLLIKKMGEIDGQVVQKIEIQVKIDQNNLIQSQLVISESKIAQIQQNRQINTKKAVSQEQIKSNQSIQSNNMAFTSDNFLLKRQRFPSKLSNNNKTESYFRLTNKEQNKKQSIQIESESENSMDIEQPQQNQSQFHPISKQLQITRQIDLNTSLQICINDVIKKQLQIIQLSLRFIIIDKYQILAIINFMKNIFMSGNGEKIQQFIHLAINENSMLNLKYFSQCLLFDTNLQIIQKLEPSFYHSKNENKYNTQINIFEENIQHYIGFQFSKLPIILQPYFSYVHLSKYMQIFNFIVRVKYSQNLITKSWKMLNNYKKDLQIKQREGEYVEEQLKLFKKLFNVRYIINNFLITFENYMFLKIIQKEYKVMKLNINDLHQLQNNHIKMLDNIIRYSFIDNPNQNTSKNFKRNFAFINQFYQIIYQLTLDDLPGYRRSETQQKIQFIYLHFKKQQQFIQNLIMKLT